jgi:hypothetical protein
MRKKETIQVLTDLRNEVEDILSKYNDQCGYQTPTGDAALALRNAADKIAIIRMRVEEGRWETNDGGE